MNNISPKTILDLSNNLNCLGTPSGLAELITASTNLLFEYPQQDRTLENEIIAKGVGLKTDNIMFGNGSTEIFFTLPQLLPKGKVTIVGPTFWEYVVANKRCGNEIEFAVLEEQNEFKSNLLSINLDGIASMYICNPNNPTCTLHPRDDLLELVKKHSNINFIIDETYLLFREDYEKASLCKVVTEFNNLHVVTSFSKFFSVPGFRLAFIASNAEFIARIQGQLIPYSVNPLSPLILEKILTDDTFTVNSRKYFASESMRVVSRLSTMKDKLQIISPTANFVLIKNDSDKPTKQIIEKLKSEGIIVRDTSIYSRMPENWIRLCLKKPQGNDFVIDKLKEIIYATNV